MKPKMFVVRRIFLIVILSVCYQPSGHSQIEVPEKWDRPGLYFGVGTGLMNTQIINRGIESISDFSVDRKTSLLGSVEIGYFFSKHFGLNSGINYYTYSSNLNIDSYQNQFKTVDRENESFDLQIFGRDINEIQHVDILSIPLCFNIRKPLNSKTGFFIQTGINAQIPINKTFKSSGTFTYKGFFPAYNVLLENLPDYGFPSDKQIDSNGELNLKPINYALIASLGIDYLIQNKVQVTFAAIYDRSLSDITDYSFAEEFNLSTNSDEVNSIMSGSSKTFMQGLGLKICVRYFVGSYIKNKYDSRPSGKQYLKERIRQQREGFVSK
jgi:hypothetical protein